MAITEQLKKTTNVFNELKNRILFTLLCLIVFRFGSHIPIPGIDSKAISQFVDQHSGGILGMFDAFSGGSLGRMSIFALAIMPYITSSIIIQLLSLVSKTLESIKKEGELGRKKINQYTRYLTLLLSIVQGYGIAMGLESLNTQIGPVVIENGGYFRFISVISFVAGTLFLMWLGEQMTQRGLGSGISLLVFSGIVADLPNASLKILELCRTNALSLFILMFMIFSAFTLICCVIYFEKSYRKVFIQYPMHRSRNQGTIQQENSHIPLKLNMAGVIPPIFASSILLFPLTLAGFGSISSGTWMEYIITLMSPGKTIYIVSEFIFIILFCFFYSSVVFNPNETADHLKKNGGFVLGKRPGKNTAIFLEYVLTRITVVGSLYLGLICVIPDLIKSYFSLSFYVSGVSILIVANVIVETLSQLQSHLYSHQYKQLFRKGKDRKVSFS